MKTKYFLLVILILNNPSHSLFAETEAIMPDYQKEARIKYARQTLKDYGLLTCLLDFNESSSLLKSDLQKLRSEYSFFGNGKYLPIQNEDTFEKIYDPYERVIDYFKTHKKTYYSLTYETGEIKSGSCFAVYHDKEYQELINLQDIYIDPSFLSL